jgi:predicted nucleic acid-binding protein
MSYLLDTCVISEQTKSRPAPSVVAWLKGADPEALHLSVLTLAELEKGVERLPVGAQKTRLRRWVGQVRAESAERIIAVDDAIATEWGRMLARAETSGHPLPVIDAMIGATAIVHGLSVVTRNTSDIARTGAAIVDPWERA